MSEGCSGLFGCCLFECDISKIGLVSVKDNDSKPANPWDWTMNMEPCGSGLILSLMPDLDIVIRFTPWSPRLVIALKCEKYPDSVALKKAKRNPRFGLVDVAFYYAKAVLPIYYERYLEDKFLDLEDNDF
jgi:hypothetical protein